MTPRDYLATAAEDPPSLFAPRRRDLDLDGDRDPLSARRTTTTCSSLPEFKSIPLSTRDTLASLSLRFGVSESVLRAANDLPGGNGNLALLGGFVKVPVAVSPRPRGDVGVETVRAKIRRMRVACQVDEKTAAFYVADAGGDVDAAIEACRKDDEFEGFSHGRGGSRGGSGGGGIGAGAAAPMSAAGGEERDTAPLIASVRVNPNQNPNPTPNPNTNQTFIASAERITCAAGGGGAGNGNTPRASSLLRPRRK